MNNFYDIIVVGAGPAGAMAAGEAVSQGASVMLLERKSIVGYPIRCGEALGRKSLQLLVDEDDSWVVNMVHTACFVSPGGHKVYVDNIGTGLILDRQKFDEHLVKLAQKQGVELYLEKNVVGLEKKSDRIIIVKVKDNAYKIHEIECHLLIAADGVDSRIARWAGISTALPLSLIETCIQYVVADVKIDDDICYFYMGEEIAPNGYLWIFPRGDGKANIGIGISGEKAKNRGPQYYLDRFIKEKYRNAKIIRRNVGGVPVAKCIDELCGDNFMVVGDAARQVNCLNGGGIIYCMNAGKIAGKIAAKAVMEHDYSAKNLQEYPRQWLKGLGRNQISSFELKEAILRIPDSTKDHIAGKISNKRNLSYFSIFKSVFWTNPFLLIKLIRFFK
ncbi:MAG: NAD(P)/FAD-dependent oxidoreductase [bacterium]